MVYLHPGGEAESCGLGLGDKVLAINGTPLGSSLAAAKLLRDAEGEVCGALRSFEPHSTRRPNNAPLQARTRLPPALRVPCADRQRTRPQG